MSKQAISSANGPASPQGLHSTGNMATLVAQFDWATTPLGDIQTWSPLLRSYIDLILSSPQPSLLAWGDALTMIYNDATVPTLGEKHPVALGSSYRETFSESWSLLGPEMDGCLYRGRGPFMRTS